MSYNRHFIIFSFYLGPWSTQVQLYYWWSLHIQIYRLSSSQTSCKKWVKLDLDSFTLPVSTHIPPLCNSVWLKEIVQGSFYTNSTWLYSAIAKPNMIITTKKHSIFWNYLVLICKAEITYLPPFYWIISSCLQFPWFGWPFSWEFCYAAASVCHIYSV